MLLVVLLVSSLLIISSQFNVVPCFPERLSYRDYYPCLDETSEEQKRDVEDNWARLQGEPTSFARTGYYDRLFKIGNTWNGDVNAIPSFGFNANFKKDGPYRFIF